MFTQQFTYSITICQIIVLCKKLECKMSPGQPCELPTKASKVDTNLSAVTSVEELLSFQAPFLKSVISNTSLC